jgi:glucose-6-phosphate isomerase
VSLAVRCGPHQPAVDARLAALERNGTMRRLWAKDPTLWSADPAHQEVARRRLGWLDLATRMRSEVESLRAFGREAAAEGFTRAVLLGMGGSSLAPEVMQRTFGTAAGALPLTVLDSTSPAAVRAVSATHDPARTLFLVSSKSGGTIEVVSFEAYFHEWVATARGADAGRAFAAITDAGTSLERLAGERGYRRVFVNPSDIGGRYSALSLFGLVPAALIGADPAALLDQAAAEARRSSASSAGSANPGLVLGAALGELALAGRDKVTLVLGPEIASFANWVEQLIAESTGKDGKGLVPIAGEPLASVEAYGSDRVFVALSVEPLAEPVERGLEALGRAGQPLLRGRLESRAALGGEFLRWEIATAVASAILGVDAFDEPNVTEAKQATQVALDRFLADRRFPAREPVARAGGLSVEMPPAMAEALRPHVSTGSDPVAWAAALLRLAKPGDYFALLAYLHPTPAREACLERVRVAARAATRLATTVGFGPRFLHSTGQLHKGGPNTGLFLQLTAGDGDDVPIPGRAFGFGALIEAQSIGDYEVLARRGRRVVRLHLGAEPEKAIDSIADAIAAARV